MKNNLVKAKRVLCVLLCVMLLLSNLTILTAAAAADNTTVDPHTLDQWKKYFGVQTEDPNDVELSTEYAGGVWTDKSVFDPENVPAQLTDAKYEGETFSLTDKGDNFLVALSAIASNKQIKGYSTIPTDTVFVLDLSSSMRYTDDDGRSAVDELIEATNKAIKDLLSLNKNNRVAVVVYAGNTNKSFSSAGGITQITMPLDGYTTDKDGVYLIVDPETVTERVQVRPGRWENREVPNTNPYGLAVYGGVKNSSNATVRNSFEVSTGTFMQDGIYEAMKLLKAADPVVREGVQIGTKRLPIMVLMTDGESTLGNPDYDGNDARTDLGNSTMYYYDGNTGNVGGYTYGHRDTISFVTSLTAAFAKKEIRDHYENDPLFYTLPYGNAVMNRQEALSVLNPQRASTIQNQLWTRFLNNETVTVYNSGNDRYTVKNAASGNQKLSAADRYYVDKYFPAANDDEMLNNFEEIVEEIIIQSKYYPTYVESNHDHDGYLTFVDKIGSQMEVSDVKGIAVGSRLFSGAAIAKDFANADMQADLIASIMARMGIDNETKAKALLDEAVEHGQMYYNSNTDFSHYIGWYSDADGKYLDFWYDGIKTAVPANATHIIKSYGFLGDTTVVPGVSNTDMMYMTVRVATEIATGESIVTWRIPASLIPTITYDVEVEVNSDGEIIRLIDLSLEDQTADSPIRLLYEVELRRDIQDWNLSEKMNAAGYTAMDNSGNYVFYSNKWETEPSDTTLNTYSHFEPSEKNERYYYTQDTKVLYKDGEEYKSYTGTKPSGDGYYRSYQVFEKLENGTFRTHIHYEPISAKALESVEPFGTNEWVVPKGTVHRYYDYEVSEKTANETATMAYSDNPFVVQNGDVYYTYSTQGNNGKLVVAPATGMKLTKKLDADYSGVGPYTFKLDGNIAGAAVVRLNEQGLEASRTALPADGEVTLAADETVYIVGLAAGDYTVTELLPNDAGYKVTNVKVNGQTVAGTQASVTLAERTVTDVEFTNGTKGMGSLIVSKDVNYPEGFVPADAHNHKEFTVKVTFNGDLTGMMAPNGAHKDGNAYTLTLKDGESTTFSNIREGVTYTVEELGLTSGYALNRIDYSDSSKEINGGDADQAHVVNDYSLNVVYPSIKVNGTKTVQNAWPAGAEFTLRLLEVTDFSSGTVIDTNLTATVTAADPTYEIDMSSISLDKAGIYHFRVVEDIPAEADRIENMAYDRTYGLFSVTVADENADGQLEIKAVDTDQNTALSGDAVNGWKVTKDFVNVITADRIYLNVEKAVVDAEDPAISYTEHLADITFGLFADQNEGTAPAYYAVTDQNGRATMMVPVTKNDLGANGKVYYLREIAPTVQDRVVGMHYNEDWLYKLTIIWDDQNNKAVVVYDDLRDAAGEQSHSANTVYTHVNTYTPNVVTAPVILSGHKTVNGRDELGGRTFEFKLYNATAAFVVQGNALQTVTNNGNSIRFSQTFNTPGLHYLVVKETVNDCDGITTDTAEYHVTVLVEKYNDNGTTKLRVADGYPLVVKYGAAAQLPADQLNFNNLYSVSGETSVEIGATKKLIDRPMLNAEFTFLLKEVDENGTDKAGGLELQAENDPASGDTAAVVFDKITYTEAGIHYYLITEKNAGLELNGVMHSADSYLVRVMVSDNGVGGLTSGWEIVKYNGSSANLPAAISFTNTYTPDPATLKITGTKELTGRGLADGEFTFRLTETDSSFAAVIGTPKEEQNDVHGVFEFDPLTFTDEGYRYYLVEEVVPATPAGGMTYDQTKYQVTVKVTDDHKGSLDAVITSIDAVIGQNRVPSSSIVFNNRYDATDATLPLGGTKELVGRDIVDGEFTFELYEAGATAPKATTTNVGKTFTFGELTFDAAGTYTYTVKEKKGDNSTIVYDGKEYNVVVTVVDENGVLKATKTVDGKADTVIAFSNKYDPTDAKLTLSGTKELVGRDIVDGEFTFELYEAGVAEPKTVVNAGKTFTFGELIFDTIGEYTYLIKEKKGTDATVTYDEKTYTVKITVVDENGILKATKSVNGNAETAIVFTNTYTDPDEPPVENPPAENPPVEDPPAENPPAEEPPAENPPAEEPPAEEPPVKQDPPKSDNPDTGDHTNLSLWIALLVVSGGLFGVMLLFKKKVIK